MTTDNVFLASSDYASNKKNWRGNRTRQVGLKCSLTSGPRNPGLGGDGTQRLPVETSRPASGLTEAQVLLSCRKDRQRGSLLAPGTLCEKQESRQGGAAPGQRAAPLQSKAGRRGDGQLPSFGSTAMPVLSAPPPALRGLTGSVSARLKSYAC